MYQKVIFPIDQTRRKEQQHQPPVPIQLREKSTTFPFVFLTAQYFSSMLVYFEICEMAVALREAECGT
jgi:hypothetical protein